MYLHVFGNYNLIFIIKISDFEKKNLALQCTVCYFKNKTWKKLGTYYDAFTNTH